MFLFYVAIPLLACFLTWYFLLRTKDTLKLPKVSIELTEYEKNETIDAKVVDPKMPLVIDNEPDRLQCYDPATAQYLGSVKLMDAGDVEEVIGKAKKAQLKWKTSSFEERRAVMRAILEYYISNADDIVRVSVRDSGKTKLGAVLGEITPTCEKLRWIIDNGESILKTEYRGGQGLMTIHKSARVEYHPIGVLGVLAPFNYPCHNIMNHIISGLFAGNAVVSKVSEYTSWSADFYVRPVKAILESAGYSGDLVGIVTGTAACGVALVESPNIGKIIFTGSDKIGKLVMKGASKNLTPVVLELGGKDPFIVCKDVDLNWLKNTALRGVFQNNGQNCIGIERIFIEKELYQPFLDIMKEAVPKIRQGLPLGKDSDKVDLAAMTNPAALDNIEALVKDAVDKGATLHFGGKRNKKLEPGIFFEPTLITGITKDMRIAQEEVFGPVMAIVKWDSEEELIERVNDCTYALGSSIFSKDVERARRICNKVNAGMANINDFGINYLCQSLPFGGIKSSGFGRFAGPEGLRACCYPKSVTEDRIPGVKTSIPPPMCYPTSTNSQEVAKSLVGFAFSPSPMDKLSSLVNLLSGIMTAK